MKLTKREPKIQTGIGRLSSFPSTTAEEEVIKSSNAKPKNGRCENQWSQNRLSIHNGEGKRQIHFWFSHVENAFKSSDEVWSDIGFFQVLEEKLKQVVDQSKHKKSLSENSLDQTKEENQTNLSKRRVPKFFGISGICCSCNNWRLPGEPQISVLTSSQCKTV